MINISYFYDSLETWSLWEKVAGSARLYN